MGTIWILIRQKVCLIFVAIVFSLILIELFLRSFPQYSIDSYLARGSNFWEARSGLHRPSKTLGYEPIPNSAPNINSLGMFDIERTIQKQKDIYRIIVLGDSITAHGSYTHLLEKKLNNNFGYKFEVWNCGVGGYGIEQYLNYLKYKAIKYNPDMIMIGFCLNDFLQNVPIVYRSSKNDLIEYYNPYSRANFLMNRFLFRYSYLYRLLMLKLKVFLTDKIPYYNINKQRDVGSTSLKAIKLIADKKKISLCAVVFPYLKPLKEYTEDEIKEYKTILDALQMLRIDFLDLHPYFTDLDLYKLRINTSDKIHPSAKGHEIAADIISMYLLKKIEISR